MKITQLGIFLFLFGIGACEQERHTTADIPVMELPHWSLPVLESQDFKNSYSFDTAINPFYLNLDADGNGSIDLAAVVTDKASGRRGIAILLQESDSLTVFGAGKTNSIGGANWNWLIGWKGEERLTAGANIPKNPGTALILFTDKGTANWLYWDGQEWEWVAQ